MDLNNDRRYHSAIQELFSPSLFAISGYLSAASPSNVQMLLNAYPQEKDGLQTLYLISNLRWGDISMLTAHTLAHEKDNVSTPDLEIILSESIDRLILTSKDSYQTAENVFEQLWQKRRTYAVKHPSLKVVKFAGSGLAEKRNFISERQIKTRHTYASELYTAIKSKTLPFPAKFQRWETTIGKAVGLNVD